MNFAEIIKRLRTEKNVSSYQLAEAIGISSSSITHWEKSGVTPNIETLNKLCDYFEVSADYLLGRSPSRKGIPQEKRFAELSVVQNKKDFKLQTSAYEDYPLSLLSDDKDIDYFISTILDEAMLPLISPKIDKLIIKKQTDFNSGDIVFFSVNSSEAFVRKLFKTGNSVEMQSKNPYFPVKAVKRESIKVYGIVTQIIKNVRAGIQYGY